MLTAALNPSSVAIIGASDNPNKVGGRPLLYLSRFGFKGRIYPINPHRDRVQGFRSYADVASLPESPDLVIIATPGESVAAAVDECAARGVGAALVMSSGYGETSDPRALAAERAMVARARSAGMRLIGPNCQGFANFGTGAVASFSTMFLETEPADGPVGVISQSGMMSVVPYGLLRAKGIGVRHSHATGNEADVTLAEVALSVVSDPDVRLVLLYIESIRRADLLAEAAALARQRDVPIVAVKTGRTARGQAAARSHTGALANEDRVVDAFFAQHGIWRTDDIHEMVESAELYLQGWRPKHRTFVVVSNSGASCVMAADSSEAVGLELATLADSTVKSLTEQLPSFATATNPIDITAALLTDSALFGRILGILAGEQGVDLYLIALPVVGTGYDVPLFARETAAFRTRTGRAVVVAAPQESVAALFRAAGVPTFANQTDAMTALGQVAGHAALMRRQIPPGPVAPASVSGTDRGRTGVRPHPDPQLGDGGRTPVRPLTADSQFLDESESLRFLGAQGMPVVPHRLCATPLEVQEAVRALGTPVVVKACSSAIPHKSEHGLVMLDLESEEDAMFAAAVLDAKLVALGVQGRLLVAPMIAGRRELLLGVKVDPLFGPVVLIGAGGKYAEVEDDIQLLMPPFTADDARAAALRLRLAPFFAGVRGEPPLDLDALCAAAVCLGNIALEARDTVASIDLNPVLVGRQGEGVVVVDALVERRRQNEVAR